MIYVDEKYLTIAGKKIPGQVQSVTITEEGKIEDKKNSKGKVTKANQPTGFEAAKVEVSMYFEEDGSYTAKERIWRISEVLRFRRYNPSSKPGDTEGAGAGGGDWDSLQRGGWKDHSINGSYRRGCHSHQRGRLDH